MLWNYGIQYKDRLWNETLIDWSILFIKVIHTLRFLNDLNLDLLI